MKKIISKFMLVYVFLIMFALPFVSLAQYTVPDQGGGRSSVSGGCLVEYQYNKNIGGLFDYVTCIIGGSVIGLLFAVATAFFLYGVVQFLMNAEDQEKQAKGKAFMIWGIVALAVMFSVWGLVGVLQNTFDVKDSTSPDLPTLKI